MALSKQRTAALVKRFPFALSITHALWRLTRPRFSAGVVGVLLNPLGEILLVEHVYHSYPQWGLPGGYVDRGEDPRDTIARELREELELHVEVGALLALELSHGDHLDVAYLCRTDEPVGRLCSELLDFRWIAPAQLPDLRTFQRKAIQEALAIMDVQV